MIYKTAERKAFEAFVLEFTGRDMAYHEQYGTWGLGEDSFAWACWMRCRTPELDAETAAEIARAGERKAFEAFGQ